MSFRNALPSLFLLAMRAAECLAGMALVLRSGAFYKVWPKPASVLHACQRPQRQRQCTEEFWPVPEGPSLIDLSVAHGVLCELYENACCQCHEIFKYTLKQVVVPLCAFSVMHTFVRGCVNVWGVLCTDQKHWNGQYRDEHVCMMVCMS